MEKGLEEKNVKTFVTLAILLNKVIVSKLKTL